MTAYVVSSGVTSIGLTLQSGDTTQVLSGGAVVDTTVLSGALLQFASGGVASGVTVVEAGGVMSGPGSIESVTNDIGLVSGVTLASGAALNVETAGMAVGVTALGDAQIDVASGAIADDTSLAGTALASLVVAAGGQASGALLESGQEIVSGVDQGAVISGGELLVAQGGATFFDAVLSGGEEVVSSGGAASDVSVASGGLLLLQPRADVGVASLAPGAIIDVAGVLATGADAFTPGELEITSGGVAVATLSLSGGAGGLTFVTRPDGAGGTDVVALRAAAQDLNGDGQSDILVRGASGYLGAWLTSGGGFTGQDLGVIDPSWTIQAVGDFNGDGQADILWRNSATDQVGEWLSSAGAGAGDAGFATPILAVVDASWAVQGVGAFNGDGLSDILWRRTDGEIGFWLTGASGGYTPVDLGVVDPNWVVEGIGDFNGDGKADILWRNTATNEVGEWLSTPGPGLGAFTTPILNVAPASWQVQGVGDFTGDGLSDILWRNSDGDTGVWLTNAAGGYASVDIGTVSTAWTIEGVGDYNGDGKADILWRNADGQFGEWLANAGTGYTGFTAVILGSVPASLTLVGNAPPAVQAQIPPVVADLAPQDFNGDGASDILVRGAGGDLSLWLSSGGALQTQDLGVIDPSWTVQAAGDFNGDGKADILWRNTATNQVGEWLSTPGAGQSGFTTPILAVVDPSWTVQGAGDFDGDGLADILWRRTDGETGFWLSSAGGGYTPIDIGVIDPNWVIQGIGDFNGDGKADILWRNTATNQVGEWLSNAGPGMTGFAAPILATVDPSWRIQGVGDFTGGGLADILWRNTDGDTGIWITNGKGGFTAVDIGTVESSWSIQAVGDDNGDGKADILWRNSATGQYGEWLSAAGTGFTGFTTEILGTAPAGSTFFADTPPALQAGAGASAAQVAQAMAAMAPAGGGAALVAQTAAAQTAGAPLVAAAAHPHT